MPTVHVDQHQREVSRLSPRGDVACGSAAGSTPIRSITERPSLAPSSSTRRPVGVSCEPLSPKGGRRAYHVPRVQSFVGQVADLPGRSAIRPTVWFRSRLSAGGTTSAPGEFGAPRSWPRTFWSKRFSSLRLAFVTTFNDASPELTLPHDPGSQPPHAAGSRNEPRGCGCHPEG